MIKRILATIGIIAAMLLPALPVKADAQTTVLPGGYVSTFIGLDSLGRSIWRADFSAPKYCDDLVTPIDTTWKQNGVVFDAGANKFAAGIAGDGVSIGRYDGGLAWTPAIQTGTKSVSTVSNAKILAVDPLNAHYRNNTVEWDYGDGLLRRVRLIEGMLEEYYVVTKPLTEPLTIQADKTGTLETRPIVAWDADYNAVNVTSEKGTITLDKDVVGKYPLIIDPSLTFTVSASDGVVYRAGSSWADARQNIASGIDTTNYYETVGVSAFASSFTIWRDALYFDTSALGGKTVSSAHLSVYVQQTSTVYQQLGAWTLRVENGGTHPEEPLTLSEYNYTYYTGNGGNISAASLTVGAYNSINLTATGISWISTNGTTRFMLREYEHDSANVSPGYQSSLSNKCNLYTYECGDGYWPQLVVDYVVTAPAITASEASNIGLTNARLNSVITDDGGDAANCSVRFGYGTVTQTAANFNSYNWTSAWVGGYSKNDTPYFDTAANNLTAATQYYYRAQIQTANGTVTSANEITFGTTGTISVPTAFSGLPKSSEVDLSWTRGSGDSRVLVLYSTLAYPNATTNGTLVYLGADASFLHTGLDSGRTYYYSIWGESGGNYSSSYLSIAMTTLPSITGTSTNHFPTIPNFSGTPDFTVLHNLEPVYSIVNNFMDDLSIPEATGWVGIILLIATMAAATVAMATKNLAAGFIVEMILLAGGWGMNVLPGWIWVFELILGMGVLFTVNRGGVTE